MMRASAEQCFAALFSCHATFEGCVVTVDDVRERAAARLARLAVVLADVGADEQLTARVVASSATWQLPPAASPAGLSLDASLGLLSTGDEPPPELTVVWDPGWDASGYVAARPAVWTADFVLVVWSEHPPVVSPVPRFDSKGKSRVHDGYSSALNLFSPRFAVSSVTNYGVIVNHLLGLELWLAAKVSSAPVSQVNRTFAPALERSRLLLAAHTARVEQYFEQVLLPVEQLAVELAASRTSLLSSAVGRW